MPQMRNILEGKTTVATLTVVVVAVVLVLVYSYFVYDGSNQDPDDDLSPVTLTFEIDDDAFYVTIGGKEIADGDTYSFPDDGSIEVTSKIGAVKISFEGAWSTPDGEFKGDASGFEYGESTTIDIVNTAYYGEEFGTMKIFAGNDPVNMDYPVSLVFTIDDDKFTVVTDDGKTIKNGDSVDFYNDTTLTITSKVGRTYINWEGEWAEAGQEPLKSEGSELGTSTQAWIDNTAYFGKMTGTFKVFQGSEE